MFFAIGVAAGALTGVPIGPVNVAVIDAAYRHTMRRALSVGLGGAIADGLYAALGVLGVTPILNTYPAVPPILYAVSGIVLLFYGFLTARSQPVAPATNEPSASESTHLRKEMMVGFKVGLALIILNPAAIVTWVVIMGSIIPTSGDAVDGIACALGVMFGSFGWFALVAYLTHRGRQMLGEKAAWIPRVVGLALMVYALYLLSRAVKLVIA
jgi:threonine/homoserine/homoserine lactone efflux protein